MKKYIVALMAIMLGIFVSSTALCESCEPGMHDFAPTYIDYAYTDMGDYHEVYTLQRYECTICGIIQIETAEMVGIEGHNLTLKSYNPVHDSVTDTHEYIFQCMDCYHEVKIWGECDGPPCMIGLYPIP